jgi:uncharacterized damage-inducible protein DinB
MANSVIVMTTTNALTTERADLLESLGRHRFFLRFTARDLTDEQARQRTTPSALTVGGLIKHVTATEGAWAGFITDGPASLGDASDPNALEEHLGRFQMTEDDTLADLIAAYEEVAARTDALVASTDLDAAHPLPEAPWFEPGATWSARRAVLHIIAETSQHAGHADIIREAIDGAKTMG